MRIKTFIAYCFVVVLFNFCNQKKEMRSILTVDCYWDIKDKEVSGFINSCYKFERNGECNFYYYNFFNKKKTDSVYLYDNGDVIIHNEWSLIKDSILLIREIKYSIVRYNSDRIVLKGMGNDTVVLIKNCITYNPKNTVSK